MIDLTDITEKNTLTKKEIYRKIWTLVKKYWF